MALKTCTLPAGSLQAFGKMEIQLSQDTIVTATGVPYPNKVIPVTAASDGSVSVQLQATNDLTPNGTYYNVSQFEGAGDTTYPIQVPQTAGPFVLTALIVTTPTASPSPNHVSTLTVDGGVGSPTITNGDIAARSFTAATGSGPYGAFLPGAPTVPTPAGVATGIVWDYGGFDYNIRALGAKGTGKILTDAAITNGQAVLTSPSNALLDSTGAVLVAGSVVGVVGAGAAGATLVSTVLASPAPTSGSVTLANNAGGTVSGATAAVGADDTVAAQAWLNKSITSGQPGTGVGLSAPGGIYLVTSSLIIPKAYHTTVRGGALRSAYFLMLTDNQPVLRTADENIHSWYWDQISAGYLVSQTGTNAFGLMFSSAASANALGWYLWRFGTVYFENCYVGMGFDPTGSGRYCFWSSDADALWFKGTKKSAISMISPTRVGSPTVNFRSVRVLNTGTGVTPTGAAIDVDSIELKIDSLDVETWANHHVSIAGNYPVAIRQAHFEHMVLNAAPDWVINVAEAPVTISEIMFESTSVAAPVFGGGNVETLFQIGATGRLRIERVTSDLVAPSTGNYQLVKASVGAKIYIEDVKDLTSGIGASNIPAPTADTTTLNAIQQFDNQFVAGLTIGGFRPTTNFWIPTGYIAETLPRQYANMVSSGANLASGTIRTQGIILPSTQITNVGFWSAVTALTRGSNADSHVWFGIADSARKILAITADDTASAWAANSAHLLALTAPYTPPLIGLYYLFLMVNIGTGGAPALPTLWKVDSNATLLFTAPVYSSIADTGQTTPPSVGATLAAPSNVVSTLIYGYVT